MESVNDNFELDWLMQAFPYFKWTTKNGNERNENQKKTKTNEKK